MKRDLLSLADLGAAGVRDLLRESARMKRDRHAASPPRPLAGLSIALLFDKPSTRTRLAFEVAAVELGAHPLLITHATSQVGRGEPIEDTARVLGRMVAAVACRTDHTARLEALARACSAPVLNALTDDTHPLQTLADLMAVEAARGRIDGLRYAWIGDASNVARSWIEAAGLLGLTMVLASPEGFGPPPAEVADACRRGADVTVTDDPRAAAAGADVVLTDVWVSMGQEAETARKKQVLEPYRVTRALVESADRDVVVLHCLPAHRGEEIDADVLDGPRSIAWDAVEARLHTTKAALLWALPHATR